MHDIPLARPARRQRPLLHGHIGQIEQDGMLRGGLGRQRLRLQCGSGHRHPPVAVRARSGTPATPSNTASILPPATDKSPWPQGLSGCCDAGGRRVFAYRVRHGDLDQPGLFEVPQRPHAARRRGGRLHRPPLPGGRSRARTRSAGVLDRLGLEPWDITRTQEAAAKELGLKEWAAGRRVRATAGSPRSPRTPSSSSAHHHGGRRHGGGGPHGRRRTGRPVAGDQ